jgi:N4-bis(aminopropyl)spermidine synthase
MRKRVVAPTSQTIGVNLVEHPPVDVENMHLDVVVPRIGGAAHLSDRLRIAASAAEREAAQLVHTIRPQALRAFDQIAMRPEDLLLQAKLMAPYLAGKAVAFVDDADCAALLFGLLGSVGAPQPAFMTVLDFDERLLLHARHFADQYGFGERLRACRYNVFDLLPSNLLGRHDWFYVNPPYGSRNLGASARLFIERGCELVRPAEACGCIILPDDPSRPWSRRAMAATQRWLLGHGWLIGAKVDNLHRYFLDDDPGLASSLMLVEKADPGSTPIPMPHAGRRVKPDSIPHFYGQSVLPPYPHFVREDGSFDFEWGASVEAAG